MRDSFAKFDSVFHCSADDLALLDLAVHLGAAATLAREHRVGVMPIPAGSEEAKPRCRQRQAVGKARRCLRSTIAASTHATFDAGLAQPRRTCRAVDGRATIERCDVAADWHTTALLNHAQKPHRRHALDVHGVVEAATIAP